MQISVDLGGRIKFANRVFRSKGLAFSCVLRDFRSGDLRSLEDVINCN